VTGDDSMVQADQIRWTPTPEDDPTPEAPRLADMPTGRTAADLVITELAAAEALALERAKDGIVYRAMLSEALLMVVRLTTQVRRLTDENRRLREDRRA